MLYPAHIDGCSVVILRQLRHGFQVVERGVLTFDGEKLSLGEGQLQRVFTDNERDSLMPVAANSRIPECQGFDFFVLAGTDVSA
jgi:hypothetical protein